MIYRFLLSLLLFVSCDIRVSSSSTEEAVVEVKEIKETPEQIFYKKIKQRADSAFVFSKEKGLSMEWCILVDMRIHSGKNRLFIWDFATDSVTHACLCAHGYGMESTQTVPVFSNVEGSYCTSLGKYKIGARSYSNWGINIHYKLHGLENTNSNAFSRWIVLHSHTPIPNYEIHPYHLPLGYSQGCPVIDDETMTKLDKMLQATIKPILLWIYY